MRKHGQNEIRRGLAGRDCQFYPSFLLSTLIERAPQGHMRLDSIVACVSHLSHGIRVSHISHGICVCLILIMAHVCVSSQSGSPAKFDTLPCVCVVPPLPGAPQNNCFCYIFATDKNVSTPCSGRESAQTTTSCFQIQRVPLQIPCVVCFTFLYLHFFFFLDCKCTRSCSPFLLGRAMILTDVSFWICL